MQSYGQQKRIGIYPAGGVTWFDRVMGTWRAVYQLTPQLPDSALEYAYMSCALPMTGPIGPGTHCYQFDALTGGPSIALPNPKAIGLPTAADSLNPQPLTEAPVA